MYTPWGSAQTVTTLVEGITSVSTASHGGIKLDAEHNRRMPEYMRRAGGWYEEDCDWCLPFVVFEAELRAGADEFTKRQIAEGVHVRTFRNWHPDAYERYYGVEIAPGESTIKDERRFYQQHAQDYLVTSAFGSWHAKVPKGQVGVCAKVGGRDGQGPEKWFLIPEPEYKLQHLQFVVDPSRHQEIEPIQ